MEIFLTFGQLDEEQIKEKKRQRLMKAAYDARQRVKKEKEREKEVKVELERREEQEREQDLQGWAVKLRRRHQVSLLSHISSIYSFPTGSGNDGPHKRAQEAEGSADGQEKRRVPDTNEEYRQFGG